MYFSQQNIMVLLKQAPPGIYSHFQCFSVASHVLPSPSVTKALIHLALMLRNDPSPQHSLCSNNSQQEELIEQPPGPDNI